MYFTVKLPIPVPSTVVRTETDAPLRCGEDVKRDVIRRDEKGREKKARDRFIRRAI